MILALTMATLLNLFLLQFPSQQYEGCEDHSEGRLLRVVPGVEEVCVCVRSYYLSLNFLI